MVVVAWQLHPLLVWGANIQSLFKLFFNQPTSSKQLFITKCGSKQYSFHLVHHPERKQKKIGPPPGFEPRSPRPWSDDIDRLAMGPDTKIDNFLNASRPFLPFNLQHPYEVLRMGIRFRCKNVITFVPTLKFCHQYYFAKICSKIVKT